MYQPQTFGLRAYDPLDLLQVINSHTCAMDYDFTDPKSCHKTVYDGFSLGDIDVFKFEGIGIRRGYRTVQHIRNDHIDDIHISIPSSAMLSYLQPSTRTLLEPGFFCFATTAHPGGFHIKPMDWNETFSMIHVRVAGPLLRRRVPHIDNLCYRPVRLQPGPGRAMQLLFELALSDGHAFIGNDARQFANLLVDSIANVAHGVSEFSDKTVLMSSRPRNLLEAARTYIDCNLSNPALDADQVASHCQVSTRYLYRIFGLGSSVSIATYIRESRLNECRRALKSPTMTSKSITEIAMLWGFNDLSYFGRAYKAKFGVTPSNDRSATS